jgi:hypothetical protein
LGDSSYITAPSVSGGGNIVERRVMVILPGWEAGRPEGSRRKEQEKSEEANGSGVELHFGRQNCD